MSNQQVQVNFEEVIQDLTQQISQLTVDNAVLKSLVSQYQKQAQQEESSDEEVVEDE